MSRSLSVHQSISSDNYEHAISLVLKSNFVSSVARNVYCNISLDLEYIYIKGKAIGFCEILKNCFFSLKEVEQQNQAETEEQQEQMENLERSLEEEKGKRHHFEEELARNLQVSFCLLFGYSQITILGRLMTMSLLLLCAL